MVCNKTMKILVLKGLPGVNVQTQFPTQSQDPESKHRKNDKSGRKLVTSLVQHLLARLNKTES
jgi:hypothetical protein